MKSVIIVEDEIIVAESLRLSLEKSGYNVVGVTATGENGIELASRNKADIVLMDIGLKGEIDGIEAGMKIYETYKIPILIMTAYGDDNTLARIKESTGFFYIPKPYTEEELVNKIESALAQTVL